MPNIVLSTAHTFRTAADLFAFKEAEVTGQLGDTFEYSRYGNPTERLVEKRLAELENAEDALLLPSGMSAVTTTLLSLALSYPQGSQILKSGETYRQTKKFCDTYLTRMGIEVTYVPPDEFASIETRITPKTKAIFLESPSNPYLRVADVKRIAALKAHSSFHLIVDSTFASPINQQPLTLGADLVIHSATKYLAGHNDLLAGAVLGSASLVAAVREQRGRLGPNLAPEVAFRLGQYLAELPLRVQQQNETALTISRFLELHPAIERVWYPGLSSHPDHAIAREQLSGFGGVLSFTVRGSLHDTARFIENARAFKNGPSFGGPEPLIEQPAIMSYYGYTPQQRLELGINDNLVRMAVGLGDPRELIADLEAALQVLITPTLPSRAERSKVNFPVKARFGFLNNCGAASVYLPAVAAQSKVLQSIAENGGGPAHSEALNSLHFAGAKLFDTTPDNISFIRNCAEGLCMIAHGFPFRAGDEIILYRYEYPSNYHAWKLQEQRGVTLKFIEGTTRNGKPERWSIDELKQLITERTKLIALSHVQFTSGFACNVEEVAALCRENGIALVIDAAQSAGALPVYPERWGVDAVVTSGWKWLLGPIGSGLLYTSPEFRRKIIPVMIGPDMMEQGDDYLNYDVRPRIDGKKFEYSTVPSSVAAGLAAAINGVAGRYGAETIWKEIRELQEVFKSELPPEHFILVEHPEQNRSGILAFETKVDPLKLRDALAARNILCSVRGGYLRIAPHFYLEKTEAMALAKQIAELGVCPVET